VSLSFDVKAPEFALMCLISCGPVRWWSSPGLAEAASRQQ